MNILIAPATFKDCLPAREVASALARGIHEAREDITVDIVPMADGGEGTVDAIVQATGGSYQKTIVHDPLMRPIEATYGYAGNTRTAVVEMAAASGIERLEHHQRNPWHTTTYGTGELIKAAVLGGCDSLILGAGGSATVDGGTGALEALGIQFLDEKMRHVPRGGAGLSMITRIKDEDLTLDLKNLPIILACDVDNELVGARGAAKIYGPQKGADPEMVQELEDGLKHLAKIINKKSGSSIENLPGGGAAGGMAAGMAAFLNAKLRPGFEIIASMAGLEKHIKNSQLVITGEGRMDLQTLHGKTPFGVLKMAKRFDIPVIAVSGTLGTEPGSMKQAGFREVHTLLKPGMSVETSIKTAAKNLESVAYSIARNL